MDPAHEQEKMILVLCSVPDMGTARSLTNALFQHNLAACVGILPAIESHYVWKGKRECSQEVLLKVKAPAENWENLRDTLLEVHPYDCPEILCFEVTDSSSGYAQWVQSCC